MHQSSVVTLGFLLFHSSHSLPLRLGVEANMRFGVQINIDK